MQIVIHDEKFVLSPLHAAFWEKKRKLLLADLHLSKELHFRKNGIAVPGNIMDSDLKKINLLIQQFNPKKVLILGDFFHSEENAGFEKFLKWRLNHRIVQFTFITGNHDILEVKDKYIAYGIDVIAKEFQDGDFLFTHIATPNIPDNNFNFCGHIHPCIIMHGKGKQTLKLPCFWFTKERCVLPAFGSFTGTSCIKSKKGDNIFAIGEGEIFKLQ